MFQKHARYYVINYVISSFFLQSFPTPQNVSFAFLAALDFDTNQFDILFSVFRKERKIKYFCCKFGHAYINFALNIICGANPKPAYVAM